jgi:ubiquinone/menaquinone biosynthesis C-methylase UbiE
MADNFIERLSEVIDPWGRNNRDERNPAGRGLRAVLRRLYWWSQREYAIRYLPIIRELRSGSEKDYSRVLEVGSGLLGLARYTGRKVIGVDLIAAGARKDNLFRIAADAGALPFKANSIDLVVSLDTLEHIPAKQRKEVVSELLRVARKKVYLGCPTREKAQLWEDKVRAVYERKIREWKRSAVSKQSFIERNSFLAEHERYGLPYEDEISRYIEEAARESGCVCAGTSFDNEQIRVWYYAVLGDMKYSYFRWALTAIFYGIFFSLLARIKKGGCYRKIFVIEKKVTP